MFKLPFNINNIFCITKRYNNGSVSIIIKILGFKISYKIKNKKIYTGGKNNKIFIEKNNILKEVKEKIPGLLIDIQGHNNTIVIGSISFINCSIRLEGNNNKIILENTIFDYRNLNINTLHNSFVHIKENVSTNGAIIHAMGKNSKIIIGQDCMLSWGIQILCGDGHIILDNKTNKCINNNDCDNFCEIGNHVWIGSNNTICKNVKIQDNCIIGTCSVVTKSFDEKNCIIAGNPAKIIKKNINWDRKNFID